MSIQTDTTISLLKPYGLSAEESRVYLDLLENSTSSVLEMSKRLKMGRTKVYRILDKLLKMDLVIQTFDDRGFKFSASNPRKLEQLVKNKQAELLSLQSGLPSLIDTLSEQTGYQHKGSQVRYYSGKEGLKRVNFNVLRAKSEVVSFEISTACVFLDEKDAEKLRRRLVEEKITVRTITNAVHMKPFTQVSELVKNFWEIRHMPESEFSIKAEMFVYNDVYLIYHYTDNDVFCIEIYNQNLADMQKQLFEYLWSGAQKMEKIGDGGEVKLASS